MAKNQLKSEEKKLCAYLLPVFLPQNHKKKTPARILVQHLDARHQCLARSGLRMSVHRHRMRNHDQEWGDMVNDSTGLSRFKVKRNCHIFESSEAGSPAGNGQRPRGAFFWGGKPHGALATADSGQESEISRGGLVFDRGAGHDHTGKSK